MKPEIKIESQGVQDALNQLLYRAAHLNSAMARVAAVMASATEGAFADEADPVTGQRWAPLSEETTIPFRLESGHWPGKMLQVGGGLDSSIETAYGEDFAMIGTNLIYARIQHEGGRTSPASMIFDEEIPARPFLGLSVQDQQDAVQIIRDFLAGL